MNNDVTNYLQLNQKSWDSRLESHVASAFYDVKSFIEGRNSLNAVELDLLGNVSEKSLLHLQCHFGQDTLSLQRMGAHCTGLDISKKSIEKARELNKELGLNAHFICSDVYAARANISEKFDIVFTSYGTIGWLPDLKKWAEVIVNSLKPGGRFVLVDFHPVVWMFDNQFRKIEYSYFNVEAIIDEHVGTYAAKNSTESFKEVGWNHSFSELFTSLLQAGLNIRYFSEYDASPYNCFEKMKKRSDGQFVIEHLEGKIPMLYALEAVYLGS